MRLPLALALAVAATPLFADDRITEARVTFAAGASSASITGSITGDEIRDFIFGARGGQTMEVRFTADTTSADFHILPPGSDPTALDLGSPGAAAWSGKLPYDGDYRVRVFHFRGPADNGVTTRFGIEVAISGAPDPDAPAAPAFGPAEVDAESALPCGGDNAAFGGPTCAAKILRYSDGATSWIQRPDGTARILYWQEAGFSTDSAEAVSAARDGDNWVVRVGEEVYRVPDAWLTGD